MSDNDGPSVDRAHNAGAAPDPYNLDFTRIDAQVRATALHAPVDIFKHVGGRHPTKGTAIHATGKYLWRDVADEEGRPFPNTPRYYEMVERVEPAS